MLNYFQLLYDFFMVAIILMDIVRILLMTIHGYSINGYCLLLNK